MRLNLFRRHRGTSGRLGRVLKILGPTWSGTPLRRGLQVLCLLAFLVLFFYVCWPYGSREYAEAFRAKEIVDAELFLLLDPLVSLSTALAAKVLPWSATAAGIVVVVCLLFPRAFCGYACPLGTLLDGFDWLIGRRIRRFEPKREDGWAHIRYYLLTVVLVAAVFGVLLSGFVAAIPVLTRAMLFLLAPVQTGSLKGWYLVPPANLGHLLSILLVVLTFGLGFLGRRFWCCYVCPTGALFSIWNAFRLSERRVTDACVECGQCVKACSFAAINEDFSTRFLNCTFCQSCAGVCPAGAIEFTTRVHRQRGSSCRGHLARVCRRRPAFEARARGPRHARAGRPRHDELRNRSTTAPRQPQAQPGDSQHYGWEFDDKQGPTIPKAFGLEAATRSDTPGKSVVSRRGVLAGLGTASVAGIAAPLVVGNAAAGQSGEPPIRPPGSVPEGTFLQLCVRCGACIKVCPNNVLQVAGFEDGFNGLWTPKVVPDWSGCEPSCNNCGQVCPTGAVRALTLEEKRAARIGLALVDPNTCLPYAGRGACQLCVEECRMAGYDAIEFLRVGGEVDEKGQPVEGSGWLAPVVREDRCVGCGLCQMRCRAINVKAEKRLPRSAIRVVAGEGKEDRVLSGSYVALHRERAQQKQAEEEAGRPQENAESEYLPDFLK